MANTTDFYSFPARKVYENDTPQKEIVDRLFPSAYTDAVDTTHAIVVAWDAERPFTHLYFKGSGVNTIQYNADTDLMGSGSIPPARHIDVSSDDTSKGVFYKLGTKIEDAQYIRFVWVAKSGETPSIEALVPCEHLLSFPDGVFSQIEYQPSYPTRGQHKMLTGGIRPFQGLGVKKRKMVFGAEQMPYTYVARELTTAATGYLQVSTGRYVNPDGYSELYADVDMSKLNDFFDDHLTFLFADSIESFSDRVFVASFESNVLDQPFSNQFKHVGYTVSFTVCER